MFLHGQARPGKVRSGKARHGMAGLGEARIKVSLFCYFKTPVV